MIWVLIILVAFATLLNAFLIYMINNKVDEETKTAQLIASEPTAKLINVDRRLYETNKRLDDTIKIANNNDAALANKIAEADRQIEEIISRMDYLAKTIEKVDADEKEIRSYYVNFREPRFDNAGVEWSEEYVTHDD